MFSRGGAGRTVVRGAEGVGGNREALRVRGGGVGDVGVEPGGKRGVAGRGVAFPGLSPGGGFGYTGDTGDPGGVRVGEVVEICGEVVEEGDRLVDMVCGEGGGVLF